MGNLKNLDAFLDYALNERGIAGAGLRVYQGTECLYDKCQGFADAENEKPFRPDSICQLASMTKCIAVAAAMQLYEKGLFMLTDPVEKFIPEFADRKVYYTDGRGFIQTRPAKSPVLVGHLFDMTSDISVGWETPTLNGKEMSEGVQQLLREGRYTVMEYAKLCGRIPGNFDPGEHFYYGDSHNILGALIEVLTGKTFGTYLRENIFEPLGMEDTFFIVPEEKKDRQAVLYAYENGVRKPGKLPSFFFDPNFESACGGLYGTLEDYSRFARAMTLGELNGVSVLGKRTVKLMTENRLNETALSEFRGPDLAGYGYGLGVRTHMDPSGGFHSSIGEFGWSGAWGTWVAMDPDAEITIVYFQSANPSLGNELHPRILEIVYSAL